MLEKQIGEYKIEINPFGALKALALREELATFVGSKVGSIDTKNLASIIPSLIDLIYKIPPKLYLKLFANCYVSIPNENGIVGKVVLDNEKVFDIVFANNLEGISELALEVIDYNGFFTMNTIMLLKDKLPKAIKETVDKTLAELKKA